ncbi:hypothetical protein [Rhodopirellula sp. MGV]|uniref:hypothetical protein n=1 Tax=Rhodopirellula sp. MGV TaxID=2023130 RepID=UPI000B962B8C|nr:hypothetical protein [Rhodopirellula sp. MGV]OYP35962.1 hypothetical protein CGZ80_09370 [Rhodopirellula sp. MGV]PNY36681.1 hypothetical protein C2E31_12630 [Rhodopirellula baltica]
MFILQFAIQSNGNVLDECNGTVASAMRLMGEVAALLRGLCLISRIRASERFLVCAEGPANYFAGWYRFDAEAAQPIGNATKELNPESWNGLGWVKNVVDQTHFEDTSLSMFQGTWSD